tara:strand:- start:6493 stop:6648 length:156 start_codon:yes stop_codon:yes gene_type:complete
MGEVTITIKDETLEILRTIASKMESEDDSLDFGGEAWWLFQNLCWDLDIEY